MKQTIFCQYLLFSSLMPLALKAIIPTTECLYFLLCNITYSAKIQNF